MPVALLAEGVDRNEQQNDAVASRLVALLAEGVDRNDEHNGTFEEAKVALLAEGVDRNNSLSSLNTGTSGRPPRRGRG